MRFKYTVNLVQAYLNRLMNSGVAYELIQAGIPFKIQHPIPVSYKQIKLDCGYRVDLLADDQLTSPL